MAASREKVNQDLNTVLQTISGRSDSYDVLANHQKYLDKLPRTENELEQLVIKNLNNITSQKEHLSESQQLAFAQQLANYEKLNAIKAGVWQG